jgi:hypothetical protein
MIEMKKNIEVKCRSKIQERAQVFAKDAYFSVGFVQKVNMGKVIKGIKLKILLKGEISPA